MALTLRERCAKRLVGLKANRQPYEAEMREIASLAQPVRSRWLATDQNRAKRQQNKKLYSSHGIFAFRTLQGGMTSGLSSESRPWFTLKTHDDDLMEDEEVRHYLSEVERRLYAFFASTNFYGATKAGYLEMGLFGTEACVSVEHQENGLVFHQLTAGEYYVGLGDDLRPAALYRDCPMTVIQAVQAFGLAGLAKHVRDLYDNGDYDITVKFAQAIERNDDQVEDRADTAGMPWRSVYWDENDDNRDRLVSHRGAHEQPFWAPRWDAVGGDAWGQGPGQDSLPDLRELQLQVKRKAEATDMLVWPEMVTKAGVKLRRQPKSVVSAAGQDLTDKLVHVPHQVPYQAVAAIIEDIGRLENAIDRATYAELFMAITNMQGVQPRNIEEIAARNEEKLTQLGPVIGGVNVEKLGVAVRRAYGVLSRFGMLPPEPEALQEAGFKVEFVSILTQMQRMVGLGQIERTVSFVGSVAAIYPEARHKLDPFELIDEYASRAGAPPQLIVPTERARELTTGEIEDAKQQQFAEMVAKMAPVGKVAVDAAKVTAEAPASGMPAIDQILPV